MQCRMKMALPVLLAAFLAASLPKTSHAQVSGDEQALWKLEHDYLDYVQANNFSSYAALWDKNFLGWPSVSPAPVHKDHITEWITSQTSRGLTFKSVELKPAAIQVSGDVGVTCYWMTFKWLGKDGTGATRTMRITHTLIRNRGDWHIIGGMSMPEEANPQK